MCLRVKVVLLIITILIILCLKVVVSSMDSLPGGSTDEEVSFSRKTLIAFYREETSKKEQDKMNYLQKKVQCALKVTELTDEIKQSLRRLVSDFKIKLHQAHRNFARCINANKAWFDNYVTFPVATQTQQLKSRLGGRPSKSFEECTERTKRRKTEDVRQQLEPQELAFAAQVAYRAHGDIHTSQVIKQVALTGANSSFNVPKTHESLSSDKALSLVIEGQLSKFQYNTLRTSAMEMNCGLYPNYETITEAKKKGAILKVFYVQKVNAEKFKTYCNKTASFFVMNYPWYNMSTTLHKILIHGSNLLENSEIAIGLISEDAQESRNKDARQYRERFSRKFSRKLAMEDTFKRLLISSDPYITGLRKLVAKKSVSMCQDVLNLIDEPNITIDV